HRGRCDAIYEDRSIGQFLAQRFRKGNDRGLAGAVGGRIRVTVLAGNRGNVDDTTIISLTHQRHDRPATTEGSFDIDREDFLPVVDRILPKLSVRPADTGVVDQYVDRGHNPERLLYGAPHRRRIAHVGGNARGAELLPAACAASPLRSQITTLAPDATRRPAIANPNPDAPPVTTALRPLRSS